VDGHGLELDAERGEVRAVRNAVTRAELSLDDLSRPALGPHRTHWHRHSQSIRHVGQACA
jgi:hypothetical protein